MLETKLKVLELPIKPEFPKFHSPAPPSLPIKPDVRLEEEQISIINSKLRAFGEVAKRKGIEPDDRIILMPLFIELRNVEENLNDKLHVYNMSMSTYNIQKEEFDKATSNDSEMYDEYQKKMDKYNEDMRIYNAAIKM